MMALLWGIVNVMLAILVICGVVPGFVFAWVFLVGVVFLNIASWND